MHPAAGIATGLVATTALIQGGTALAADQPYRHWGRDGATEMWEFDLDDGGRLIREEVWFRGSMAAAGVGLLGAAAGAVRGNAGLAALGGGIFLAGGANIMTGAWRGSTVIEMPGEPPL